VPDYVTVYQISRQPPLAPDWLFSYAGLVPLIVGAVLIFGKYRLGWRRPNWPLPLFFCLLGIVLFYIAGSLATFVTGMNSEALTSFETGHYSVVEGIVTDFHPMPYEGHDDECFTVASQRFCYSDYALTPGFRNTASHGGPIRAGLRVRIAYAFDTILRLEVARNQMLSPAQLTAAAQTAERQWQVRTENDPIQQRLMIAFLFTCMCWTLWWNLQWRRAMRFWVQPPNRKITRYAFRTFFGLNFIGSVFGLIQQLRVHPLTLQNAGPTMATAAIMLCIVGSMTAFQLWRGGIR
jgi:hypothetical protein